MKRDALLAAARIEPKDDPYRLYAILRRDLEMSQGKAAAQAGHAYLGAYRESMRLRPDIADEYDRFSNGTKICLIARHERDLLRAYDEALRAGLPCKLIIDQGHIFPPHFDGEPIITALGIGPASRDEARPILKRFSTL